jgi:hypothetical protein
MRLILCALIALADGCSTSHHASSAASTTTIASATTTFRPQPLCHGPTGTCPTGTITGRYYSDGGPLPASGVVPPAHPIIGTITVTNTDSHEAYTPRQNSGGYFTLTVPVGTYGVMAESRGGVAPAMTDTVTVTPQKTANADLGIHVP